LLTETAGADRRCRPPGWSATAAPTRWRPTASGGGPPQTAVV